MSKNENQKLKLIRILEILLENTDDEVGITMAEIISKLSALGIKAERKSIYDDLAALDSLGFEVIKLDTRPTSYTLVERVFEFAELKMLVDAIQSSRFITAEQSRKLISKLEVFAGARRKAELSRAVVVEDRVKTVNRASLYSIDCIHAAINGGVRLSFTYFDYGANKEEILRHGGAPYDVTPKALLWSDDNYYLVAYDEAEGVIKNFRVDKMLKTALSDKKPSAAAVSAVVDPAIYSRRIFGMYGGEDTLVTLEFDKRLVGAVIDRFGKEISLIQSGDRVRTSVRVMVSPTFFSWVFSFSGGISVASPEGVREMYRVRLEESLKEYEK